MAIKCFEWDWCPREIDFRLNGQTYSNSFGQQPHKVGPDFWTFDMSLPPSNDCKTREMEALIYCLEGTNVLCLYDPRRIYPKEFEPFFFDDGSPRTPQEYQEAVDTAQQAIDDYVVANTPIQGAGSLIGPQGAGSTVGPQGAGGPSELQVLLDARTEAQAAQAAADLLDDVAAAGTQTATVTAMSQTDKTVTLTLPAGFTVSVGDPIGFTDADDFHHYFQAAETRVSTGAAMAVLVNPRPRKTLTGVSIDFDRFKPRCRFVVTLDDMRTHRTSEGRYTNISLSGREYYGALS